jgi:hypothetical protein
MVHRTVVKRIRPAVIRGVQAGCLALLGGCSPSHQRADATPAERTQFRHTATYVETVDLLKGLSSREASGSMDLELVDTTYQGRRIPVVILARPMVHNGVEAHASRRLVVYVEASMAGGEVDAKDGMLALIRDLEDESTPGVRNVLDSVVVVFVPMANPDGNEARGPVAVNRPDQRGPDTVGTDPNGQGLTLNRDFVKTETPEVRSTLDLFRIWDPDVYIELHTNDGSFTGYAYTYAPTLHPASLIQQYTRDSLLPEIQARMRDRHSLTSFDYGTLVPPRGPGPDTVTNRRWESFDYRGRYGTNYVGLRNRIAILGVSYAHDTFERRTHSQEAFVREILSIVAERGPEIRSVVTRADSIIEDWSANQGQAQALPLAGQMAEGIAKHLIPAEDLAFTDDSTLTEAGVPRGVRRTGHITPLEIPVWNRFVGTRTAQLPVAWVFPPADSALAGRLELHGITFARIGAGRQVRATEYFSIDSIVHDTTVFERHRAERVYGSWHRSTGGVTLPPGSYFVSASQPLGALALELLDPESADGFATWNFFDNDPGFRRGGRFPVVRVIQ